MAEGTEKQSAEAPQQPKKKRFRLLRFILVTLVFVGLIIYLIEILPFALTLFSYPEITIDLSEQLKDTPPGLVSNKTAIIRLDFDHVHGKAYELRASGKILDWPFTASARARIEASIFGIATEGEGDFRFDGSALGAKAKFAASLPGEWRADVEMPPTAITERDVLLSSILSRIKMPGIENLAISAIFSFTADAEHTKALPVPKWNAKGRIKDCDISLEASGKPITIDNFRTTFGASGIANHVDISPMFPRADCIDYAGFALSNAFASVRATETAYLVTEAGADFCGGDLRLYSFFLNPTKLNAGVTLFIDGIDAGETLRNIKGFNGDASGRLHGKLPLQLKNGNELKFRDSYLFSTPGDVGNIRIYDPEPILDGLAMGGVTGAARANLANALANLDYSVLKLNLNPEGDGRMALTVKLEGSATRGEVTVPVSFEVTFHGDLEQLINTGLKAATRK